MIGRVDRSIRRKLVGRQDAVATAFGSTLPAGLAGETLLALARVLRTESGRRVDLLVGRRRAVLLESTSTARAAVVSNAARGARLGSALKAPVSAAVASWSGDRFGGSLRRACHAQCMRRLDDDPVRQALRCRWAARGVQPYSPRMGDDTHKLRMPSSPNRQRHPLNREGCRFRIRVGGQCSPAATPADSDNPGRRVVVDVSGLFSTR